MIDCGVIVPQLSNTNGLRYLNVRLLCQNGEYADPRALHDVINSDDVDDKIISFLLQTRSLCQVGHQWMTS